MGSGRFRVPFYRIAQPVCVLTLTAVLGLGSARAQQQLAGNDSTTATYLEPQTAPAEPFSSSLFSSSLALPDSPDAVAGQQAVARDPTGHQDKQPKRILGIIPNFRSVSANEVLPPQSVKEKFFTATQDSFDYSSILLPAAIAGEGQLTNATPEFHQGAAGYGRYFWHTFVDQTSENYLVEFIVPTLRHEDTRYYTLGQGGFLKRAGYSVRHVFITRSDSGKQVFNAGEIVGAGLAAGISNLYYPAPERTAGNTIQKYGTNIGIDVVSFTIREFWPDINHALFHGASVQSN